MKIKSIIKYAAIILGVLFVLIAIVRKFFTASSNNDDLPPPEKKYEHQEADEEEEDINDMVFIEEEGEINIPHINQPSVKKQQNIPPDRAKEQHYDEEEQEINIQDITQPSVKKQQQNIPSDKAKEQHYDEEEQEINIQDITQPSVKKQQQNIKPDKAKEQHHDEEIIIQKGVKKKVEKPKKPPNIIGSKGITEKIKKEVKKPKKPPNIIESKGITEKIEQQEEKVEPYVPYKQIAVVVGDNVSRDEFEQFDFDKTKSEHEDDDDDDEDNVFDNVLGSGQLKYKPLSKREQQQKRNWLCRKCLTFNSFFNLICKKCHKVRESLQWKCPRTECGYMNNVTYERCIKCQQVDPYIKFRERDIPAFRQIKTAEREKKLLKIKELNLTELDLLGFWADSPKMFAVFLKFYENYDIERITEYKLDATNMKMLKEFCDTDEHFQRKSDIFSYLYKKNFDRNVIAKLEQIEARIQYLMHKIKHSFIKNMYRVRFNNNDLLSSFMQFVGYIHADYFKKNKIDKDHLETYLDEIDVVAFEKSIENHQDLGYYLDKLIIMVTFEKAYQHLGQLNQKTINYFDKIGKSLATRIIPMLANTEYPAIVESISDSQAEIKEDVIKVNKKGRKKLKEKNALTQKINDEIKRIGEEKVKSNIVQKKFEKPLTELEAIRMRVINKMGSVAAERAQVANLDRIMSNHNKELVTILNFFIQLKANFFYIYFLKSRSLSINEITNEIKTLNIQDQYLPWNVLEKLLQNQIYNYSGTFNASTQMKQLTLNEQLDELFNFCRLFSIARWYQKNQPRFITKVHLNAVKNKVVAWFGEMLRNLALFNNKTQIYHLE